MTRRLAIGLLVSFSYAARGADVPLTVTAREGAATAAAPVTSGVPFAEGALTDPSRVRLLRGGAEVPLQVLRTASWPDGSVRWLLLDFQTDLPAAPGSVALTLQTGTAPAPVSGITITQDAATLTVATRAATFAFTKSELLPRGLPFEVVSRGETFRAVPSSWMVEESGPMKAVVRVDGTFTRSGTLLGGPLVGFRARLTFFRDKATFRAALTFRNNGPFCWAPEECTRQPDVPLEGARFGATLLAAGGPYVFGPGVERTWHVNVPASGTPTLIESRYAADGSVASGYAPPAPLALAAPAYYASTNAWGRLALPLSGLPVDRQQDFDRFEKLQRAKVTAADVEDPPGTTGVTVFGHLAQDLASWNDYGDLRWAGNGCGSLSGNHYDWGYGMYLHLLRTGRLPFADAARVFASHEADMDVYHTGADGPAYSFQKNWEDRPSHDSPDNCFGGGRPTHTWSQGYALHWLLTGDPRGRDAFEEVQEGVRRYLYESFNGEGRPDTSEIRLHGWLIENLVNLWRVSPDATLATTSYGAKTIPQAIVDVLTNVYAREQAAGGQGFVFDGDDPPDPNARAPLQSLYFVEPAIKAYAEVLKGRNAAEAARLLALVRRTTDWLISITYGGDANPSGLYRPRQIPYRYVTTEPIPGQGQGQIVYALMSANAAGFLFLETGAEPYRTYARTAFSDYIRYFNIAPADAFVDPALRSPTAYNSSVFTDTESKIQGWSSRYGQWVIAAEAAGSPQPLLASFVFAPESPAPGETVAFTDTSTGSTASWSWRFGDGATSAQRSPAHAYAAAGTYTVELTVADGTATSTATRQIVVRPAGSEAATLFVPVVLALSGRNGSFYTSELTLANRGTSAATLTFDYTGFTGGGTGSSTAAETLAPGRQLVIPDAIFYLRSKGVPITQAKELGGTLRVRFSGLSHAGAAVASVRTTSPVPPAAPIGRAGLAYAGVPASRLLSSPVLVCGLRQTAEDRAAVAVQNAGTTADGDAAFRITYYAGNAARASVEVSLPPGHFAQPPVPDLGAANGSFFARVERITGSAPWYAYGVLNDNVTNDGSFIPPLATAGEVGEELAVPVVVQAAPFTTELILTNTGGASRTLALSLPAGPASASVTLAPGEQRILPAVVSFLGVATVAGPLFVTGETAGVAVSARTSSPASGGGRYGLFYPGASTAGAPEGEVWLHGLLQNAETRTNLAVLSAGDAPVTLRIEIFSGDTGAALGSLERELPARGYLQLARVLTLVPGGASNGYARVTRIAGSAPFLTYAVVNDGAAPGERSGDGAFVTFSADSGSFSPR